MFEISPYSRRKEHFKPVVADVHDIASPDSGM